MQPRNVFSNSARDLAFAVRTLFGNKSAYFTAIAILILGLGMSVAMFSLVDAVLLRPLPFPHQDSIQVIWKTDPQASAPVVEMAYPELRDLQVNVPAFEYVAMMPTTLYGYGRVLQVGNAQPVQVECSPVSHDFFKVLGVAPAMGRGFSDADEHVGAPPVVIVSDRIWRDFLGADAAIVGHMIRLNGVGHTVIGVTAPDVDFPRGVGIWIPLGVERQVVEQRGATFLQAIARVKPSYTRKEVAAQVDALFARLAAEYRVYPRSQRGVVVPLNEYWTGSARLHLWIMLGASLLLLTAATVSAGNLLLSRALARKQEIATRAALGASLGQLLLQFAAEGIVTGFVAISGGLLLAYGAIRFLVGWSTADIPRLSEAGLHMQSFGFAAAVALLAIAVCSVVPGWFIARANLETALRSGGGRTANSRTGGRTQNICVFAQASVTVTLLVTSALLVLSYRAMMKADTGFGNRDTVSMNLALHGPGLFGARSYDLQTRHAFYTRFLARLRQEPGVTSAGAVLLRPFEGTIGWDLNYQFEYQAAHDNHLELPQANFEVITPGYFQTVGTPMLEGRDFDDRDDENGEKVIILGNSLAKRIRDTGRNPIGQRVRFGRGTGNYWMTVVGVTSSARYRGVTLPEDDVYVPYLQSTAPTNYVVVRGTRPPEELASLARQALAEIDPGQAVAAVATLAALLDRNTSTHRFNMILLLWFAACAVILAATGVYSVITEGVALRRREIAIKTVLGAPRPQLLRDMLARTLLFILAGETAGLGCVAALSRIGSGLLYGVNPRDPLVLTCVLAFLFAVSLIAALYPAWIAAGRDPNAVLHET